MTDTLRVQTYKLHFRLAAIQSAEAENCPSIADSHSYSDIGFNTLCWWPHA